MPQDSSLVGVFDLNSQTGVMSVLASIRASKLTTAEKNELRDLVFLYTNGGGEASVKISLEQKLAAHGITPVALKKGSANGPALSFGSYRPTPNFKAPSIPATPIATVAPAPAPAPVTPISSASLSAVPVAVQPPVVAPTVAPAAVITTPPAPTPTPTPAPAPAPAPEPLPVPSAPAPIAAVPVTATGEVNYLERIRQIKTAVNSKVGNPVNLVDIDNQVGREYMNALLEAMKKLSAGAVSEMDPAMQRLEAAFAAVEVAIKGHDAAASGSSANPTPVVTTQSEVQATTSVPSVPAPVAPEISVPTPPAPVAPLQAPLPPRPASLEVTAPEVPVPPQPSVASTPEPRSTIPLAEIPAFVFPQPPKTEVSEVSGFETASNPATDTTASASLADSKRILTPTDLPSAASLETGDKGDPLFTKEVDDGLEQLLADWTLFKKSGLFGTGPKGREHPLFKKIAELQVPLLLAGRFDGATQEIRQSITDYMNGWRYEQGIIYQPGETFEKYLRRVIKHILDLQKKRK